MHPGRDLTLVSTLIRAIFPATIASEWRTPNHEILATLLARCRMLTCINRPTHLGNACLARLCVAALRAICMCIRFTKVGRRAMKRLATRLALRIGQRLLRRLIRPRCRWWNKTPTRSLNRRCALPSREIPYCIVHIGTLALAPAVCA